MNDLFAVNIPVFALIAVGYGAAHFRLLDKRAAEGLSDFVLVIATPALVMRAMIGAKLPDTQPWAYWGAYFIGVALVWAAAMLLAVHAHKTDYRESVVAGFSAGQSNTVLVGIPVILQAFGEAGAVPLFLLIAVHLPINMTIATFMFEGSKGLHWGDMAKRLALHPMILSLVIGLGLRSFEVTLGGLAKMVIDGLAASAIPCALVAMGLALHHHGLKAPLAQITPIVTLKLLVHPAIVYLLAFHVFTVPPVWAGVAVLFAAMPTGINAFLFAMRYKTSEALASSAIAVSTTASLASIMLWLWILGLG